MVGAGLGRTGTSSLKVALERLLECPCYHMVDTFDRPIHPDARRRAASGESVDWPTLLDGFGATVDWPAEAFWRELAGRTPRSPVRTHAGPARGDLSDLHCVAWVVWPSPC